MIAVRNILVPTDFSEDADHALQYAVELGKEFKSRVHLLHVLEGTGAIPPYTSMGVPPLPTESTIAQVEDDLREVAQEHPGVEYTQAVHLGTAADEIVDYARKHDVDLIVIATHGRRGLARLLLGSTTERVVRTADCPVLTVRHPERSFVVNEVAAAAAASAPPVETGADPRL